MESQKSPLPFIIYSFIPKLPPSLVLGGLWLLKDAEQWKIKCVCVHARRLSPSSLFPFASLLFPTHRKDHHHQRIAPTQLAVPQSQLVVVLGDMWHVLISGELEAAISNSLHKESHMKNKVTWTCEPGEACG